MSNRIREILAIVSITISIVGLWVSEPFVNLVGALLLFAAITIPPNQIDS